MGIFNDFMNAIGVGEDSKEQEYIDVGPKTEKLTEDGTCHSAGHEEGSTFEAYWDEESQSVMVDVKTYADRLDAIGAGMPGFGCISIDEKLPEIFFTSEHELLKGAAEEQYGKDFVDKVVAAIEKVHEERGDLPSASPQNHAPKAAPALVM